MKVLKIALALAIAAISSFTAHAKNDPTTAYMFGFASSFSDSTVYMTSVQRVDSVYLTHKKLFLDNRENYSLQLKEYLESIGAPKRTCIVISTATSRRRRRNGPSCTTVTPSRRRQSA